MRSQKKESMKSSTNGKEGKKRMEWNDIGMVEYGMEWNGMDI